MTTKYVPKRREHTPTQTIVESLGRICHDSPQHKCLSAGDKMRSPHSGYYSGTKRSKLHCMMPHQHYAEPRKADAQIHCRILWVKRPENANLWEQRVNYWEPKAEEEGNKDMMANGHQGSLRDDGNVLKLDSGNYCTTYQIYWKHWTAHWSLWFVYCTLRKLFKTYTHSTKPTAEALGSYKVLNLCFGFPSSFLNSRREKMTSGH